VLVEPYPVLVDPKPPEELSAPVDEGSTSPVDDVCIGAVVDEPDGPVEPVPSSLEGGSEKHPTNKKHAHQRQSMLGSIARKRARRRHGNGPFGYAIACTSDAT
jgi:hypothetical protein